MSDREHGQKHGNRAAQRRDQEKRILGRAVLRPLLSSPLVIDRHADSDKRNDQEIGKQEEKDDLIFK